MRLLLAGCGALLAFNGCSVSSVAEKFAPQDIQEASKKAVSDLQARRFGAIEERLSDRLRGQDLRETFSRMAAVFPDEAPRTVTVLGYFASAGTEGTHFDITYEYQFSGSWVEAQFSWQRVDGQPRILKFDVKALDHSVEDENALTFRAKGPLHYLVVLLRVCAAVLSLVALVKCVRTKGLRQKWLWIIFIIFGIGSFVLNWTSGEWHINLLSFQLFSFSAAAFSGPWIVSVSVPVGAVVFLDKLRRQKAAQREPPTIDPPALG